MDFTYNSYRRLLGLLSTEGYIITDYEKYKDCENKPCVILRHDIDNSIKKALEMAKIEAQMGVQSTYFVLLSSEFYNPAAAANIKMLEEIGYMGHKIGLHFDELKYKGKDSQATCAAAEDERKILEQIIGLPIRVISMHRPSQETLNGDWKFSNMINSYSREFFLNFKYVSDSRMHWRENVEEIIQSHNFNHLHILTHAFWYENEQKETKQKLLDYLESAKKERYLILDKNFRNLSEFLTLDDI